MSDDDRIASARARYAEQLRAVMADAGDRLAPAFARVPRERYLWPPPWTLRGKDSPPEPTDDATLLYGDALVVLDDELGINNGQPSLHAMMLGVLAPASGEHVVHVGVGLGYYTAIIAELVGAQGRVTAIEVNDALAAGARERLAVYPQVEVVHGSAFEVDFAPADVIYVNAGASHPHAHWLDRLKPEGRLLTPITSSAGMPADMGAARKRSGVGGALLVTRRPEGFSARFISAVGFVTCVGDEAEALRDRVWQTMLGGGHAEVRSLRRDPHDAGDGCWFHDEGFCLSKRELLS